MMAPEEEQNVKKNEIYNNESLKSRTKAAEIKICDVQWRKGRDN